MFFSPDTDLKKKYVPTSTHTKDQRKSAQSESKRDEKRNVAPLSGW